MLKKIAKLLPIVFFTFVLGVLSGLSGSGRLNQISQDYLSTEVVVKASCGDWLTCPEGQELCDVHGHVCHGECSKASGRCCDFCGPGNTCGGFNFGTVADCQAAGEQCVGGHCVGEPDPGEECQVQWYQGDSTGTYNGEPITVGNFCLRAEAQNCNGHLISITRYWCNRSDPWDEEDGCINNEDKVYEATINTNDWHSPNICESFNRIGDNCPWGQLDGAVGDPNISNGHAMWGIPESYCQPDDPDPRTASGRVYCQDLPYPNDISQHDTWKRLNPSTDGTYPWSNGGPTTGYEDPGAGSAGLVAIHNGKWAWYWDIGASDWLNTSPVDISQQAKWQELQPGYEPHSDSTIYPWTDGGPTAAWHGPKNKRIQICNRNWCWSWDYENNKWTSTTPSDISNNAYWSDLISPNGTRPWSNGGPTAGWTNTQLKLTAVCNGKWCWNWHYENEEWVNDGVAVDLSQAPSWKDRINPSPNGTYPWSNSGPTAGWSNSGTNLIAILNNKWVWNWLIAESEWYNNNTKYPLPNLQMTIIRNSLGDTTVPTNNNGYFQVDLTGETGNFAIRIPSPLPSGTLPNGWPYSSMEGPIKNEKNQCQSGYEQCEPYHEQYTDNTGFDFRFTNCAPPPPDPQCNWIVMQGSEDLTPGDSVSFACNGTLNSDQDPYYQFRVLRSGQEDKLSSVSQSYTWSYPIPTFGDYTAQCRICSSSDINSCQQWEPVQ